MIGNIIAGKDITKDKRTQMFESVAGGSNSMRPEKWQRECIESATNVKCVKVLTRINARTNTLADIPHPNMRDDGFDYTEKFRWETDERYLSDFHKF